MVTDFPDLIKQSVQNSIIRGSDIANDLVTNMVHGPASTMTSYYHIAKTHQASADLFPTSSGNASAYNTVTTERILKQIHGGYDIITIRSELGFVDTDYIAMEYMALHYKYDFFSGSFKSLPNGLPLKGTKFGTSKDIDGEIHIEYWDGAGTVLYTEPTGIPTPNAGHIYCHHVYYVADDVEYDYWDQPVYKSGIHYWNYNVTLGEYEELKPKDYGYKDDYYPVIPVIQYGKNIVEDKDPTDPVYKLSNILLRQLSLKVDNISDALKESESYDDIEQAHFLPCVRVRDDSEVCLKYMFNHWIELSKQQIYNRDDYERICANYHEDEKQYPPYNQITYTSIAFKNTTSWYFIAHDVVEGEWKHGDRKYAIENIAQNYLGKPVDENNSEVRYVHDDSRIYYYKKITENQYEVVTVAGFLHTSHVDNRYKVEWDTSQVFQWQDPDGDPVPEPAILPLDPSVVQLAFPSPLEKNNFFFRSYNLALCMKKVVKLKWYQTGIFKFLVIVVAVVITVWTGMDFISGAMSAFEAGMIAGGLTAALVALGTYVFEYMVLMAAASWAISELINILGWEVLAAIAALLILWTGYTEGFVDLLESTMMKVANTIFTGINNHFEELTEALAKEAKQDYLEYNQWKEEYDKMMEEMFGNTFSDIYRRYTQDKAIYQRMTPDTFLFTATDMLFLLPEIMDSYIEGFVENMTSTETDNSII